MTAEPRPRELPPWQGLRYIAAVFTVVRADLLMPRR
jgi:hypothetical protein